MKKQILFFGLCLLLLFNSFSFSMQSKVVVRQENTTRYISRHLDALRKEWEKSERVLSGVPEAKGIFEGIHKREVTCREEYQRDNLLQKGDRKYPFFLISGPDGSGKTTLVEAIAKYFERELVTISPASVIVTYPYYQQEQLIENTIMPYIQRNEKCVFFIKNIEQLKYFSIRDDQKNFIEYSGNKKLRECIEQAMAKDENGIYHFIFLATTCKKDEVEGRLLKISKKIRLGYPDFDRRKKLLEDLLSSDDIVDSQACTNDKNFMDKEARLTKGFSLRELSNVVEIAFLSAFARISLQKRKGGEKVCLSQDDFTEALSKEYQSTDAAKEYQEFTKQCWFLRRWWRGQGAIK